MSYVYNIHARMRSSMECLLTNPDRNAALWNIYISFLLPIAEKEFEDLNDRKLFKSIMNKLQNKNESKIDKQGEFAKYDRRFTGMRKEASAKISMDIFELYQSMHEKYQALTPHKA